MARKLLALAYDKSVENPAISRLETLKEIE